MHKLYTTSSLRLADATTLKNQQLSVRRYGKYFLLRAYPLNVRPDPTTLHKFFANAQAIMVIRLASFDRAAAFAE